MKKISLGTAIALAIIVAILTFQITYVGVTSSLDDKYSTEGGPVSGTTSDFISNAVERLSELDETYRDLYIGELDDEVLIDYILKGYIAGTGDLYAAYYTEEELADFMSDLNDESVGIGVSVIYNAEFGCIEVINVLPDSPALGAGIKVGDLIAYVGTGDDAVSVAELGYTAALAKLKGEEGTNAEFSVVRDGEKDLLEFNITRKLVEEVNVLSHVCDLDDSVGVIKLTAFDSKTPEQFKGAISSLQKEGCKKFIIDLRYNPGGELESIRKILDYLLPEGPIVRIFDADDKLVKQYDSDASCVDFEMAVIVNSSTASAAELFTSALKDYNMATIVGETTYGKGCMQTTELLDDGGAVSVTYRMYNPPFSDNYHGVGVKPDIEVALDESLADKNIYKITDEEDNQLKAALDALSK